HKQHSETADKEPNSNSHINNNVNLEPTTHLTSDAKEQLTATELDNLPSALKAYLRTPEQKQSELDAIKAESRLRWLAFYYLSRREHGRAELKQKLIDKEQDPDKIDALLDEFRDKGYQSDYRTTLMLIRENIRKGRGRGRIKQAFYKKKIAMPGNIDELIDMANSESDEFREFVDDDDDSMVEGVDWLKLAVAARTKKYGNDIPTEQKQKARQVRFLQYRGFKSDICFAALEYTLETLDERF
ncbi:regulatory protein RecX, partial [Psychrobacter sp. T6-1]|uniref:regulatory protein RecX n=1 Tax=Psychrobacter sp. T6-1 TaxID=3457447 RepID=UPI003FD00EC4